MNRFVRPDTTVLRLAHGDTLIVKTRLNTGEQRRMFAGFLQDGPDGARIDNVTAAQSTVMAYLLDWSLTDDGRPVVIRDQDRDTVRAALDQLDFESFTEIANAIEQHKQRQAQIRDDEKKTQVTDNGSPLTSPSPFDAVGAMNG